MKALRRSPLGRMCDFDCCGPGSTGIEAWAGRQGWSGRRIILAGLAGALTPRFPTAAATFITEVIDGTSGERWRAEWPPDPSDTGVIVSVTRICSTPVEKNELHARTGADLVDLESAAFAKAASRAGWSWAIARAVSDDRETALPDGVDEWIGPAGETRAGALASSLLLRPWMLPQVLLLARSSRLALGNLARVLARRIS
jgi:hypothetical protein